jgi:hypothetical protein
VAQIGQVIGGGGIVFRIRIWLGRIGAAWVLASNNAPKSAVRMTLPNGRFAPTAGSRKPASFFGFPAGQPTLASSVDMLWPRSRTIRPRNQNDRQQRERHTADLHARFPHHQASIHGRLRPFRGGVGGIDRKPAMIQCRVSEGSITSSISSTEAIETALPLA